LITTMEGAAPAATEATLMPLETAEESELGWIYFVAVVLILPVVMAILYFLRPRPPPRPETKPVDLSPKPKPEPAPTHSGPKLKIFWGSQTGTAEDFATTICDEAKKYSFNAQTVDLEDYDVEDLAEETLAIFVMATYGEGEPTDNAKEFYEWLMSEDREPELLSSLRYTVFALGNRTYEHYNAVGREVDKRLAQLGATSFYNRGEGDDDSSLEEDFLNWKKDLWRPLCELCGIKSVQPASTETVEVKPRYQLVFVDAPATQLPHALGTLSRQTTYDQKNPFIAEIAVNKELHSDSSDRSCRHLEFVVPDNLAYEAGDHLGVFPKNDSRLVEALAARLGVTDELDKYFCLQPISTPISASSSGKKAVLGPVTVRAALTELLDITTPPRKSLLSALVQYASDPAERARLLALSSTDESSLPPNEQYAKWVKEDRRTIGEVLEAFPSVSPPLGHMLELLPDLAPRYYSISSSPKAHPGRIHITSVVVNFQTGTGRIHDGVCSTHFLRLVPSDDSATMSTSTSTSTTTKPTAPIFVRKSTFRLPPQISTPIMMVGPGTGLAPFRGFIHERRHLGSKEELGESVLFFGCRHREKDFIYKEELTTAVDEGYLSALHLAFSREQEYKIYVQDKMKENMTELWRLLHEQKGHFYICGDARHMAPSVRAVLLEAIMQCGEKTREEAEAYVLEMQENGRFSTDVWF